MRKLTNNDKNFGPFTWGWGKYTETNQKAIYVTSGDREEEAVNENLLYAFLGKFSFRMKLPRILQPLAIRKHAGWGESTVKRMGRDWYETTYPRHYGFSYSDGFLIVYYGYQRHDGEKSQSWCKHLPWMQWRHVRLSYYDTEGNLWWEQKKGKGIKGMDQFLDQFDAKKTVPAARFIIKDYDGVEVLATTIIEEHEWLKGEGWFKWLSWFVKAMTKRSLDITFSAETGTEKGSWKGGTVGTSIRMHKGDTPEIAMRRYCMIEHRGKYSNYKMTFVRKADDVMHHSM